MTVQDIENEALRLPQHERAELVEHLLATLDEADDTGAAAAWREELFARREAYRTSRSQTVDANVAITKARTSLK